MQEHSGRRLQKTSSLVSDVPTSSAIVSGRVVRKHINGNDDKSEVVPDSEEERVRRTRIRSLKLPPSREIRIVEITSDEEEELLSSMVAQPGSQQSTSFGGAEPHTHMVEMSESSEDELPVHISRPRKKLTQTPRTRRIVYSSDSDVPDANNKSSPPSEPQAAVTQQLYKSSGVFVDLTSSDGEESGDVRGPTLRQQEQDRGASSSSSPPKLALGDGPVKGVAAILLFLDDSDDHEAVKPCEPDGGSNDDDGAILILDEPRSARKPIRRSTPLVPSVAPSTPRRPATRAPIIFASDSEDYALLSTVSTRTPSSATIAAPRVKAPKVPRLTKKALAAAEQTRREAYARAFFDELNRTVFKGGIPHETELKWSKRLLTTAGKARWHKSRDGAQKTEIELAVKILDSDERIRNTLSHEMCHLACWIVNGDPKEGHGHIFKGWATKVMRARPEITVSTKHTYEITYKYEWKCQSCAKIYGRHSKSINPDQCLCGACKVGKLVALFSTRAPKTPKANADSQFASAMGRDSPRAVARTTTIDLTVEPESPVRKPVHGKAVIPGAYNFDEESDDDDVEFVSQLFTEIKLKGLP